MAIGIAHAIAGRAMGSGPVANLGREVPGRASVS
jgi:hypothetical protein